MDQLSEAKHRLEKSKEALFKSEREYQVEYAKTAALIAICERLDALLERTNGGLHNA